MSSIISEAEGYDIIGDIHGYADTLKSLLVNMGYSNTSGTYKHKSRKAVFVGDFIDRGHQNFETVSTVKNMVESGSAYAIMGNHEYNAVGFSTYREGKFLRSHSDKNIKQHDSYLKEAYENIDQHAQAIEWFKTLPLFLELPKLRVVHACWCDDTINSIKPSLLPDFAMTESFLHSSFVEGSREFLAIERLLKGPEVVLPEDKYFHDKDGVLRKTLRTRWWEESVDTNKVTFFGHYWKNGKPKPLNSKIACVDYSVAKEGKLCAYRWTHEETLTEKNFFYLGTDQCGR